MGSTLPPHPLPPSTQQTASQLVQTPYEACLYGSITGADAFRSVFDRLTLRTDAGCSHLHIRELTFHAVLPPSTASLADDMPTMVCRYDLLKEKGGWTISTYGKPEPVRLHPIAIVRPAVYARAQGDIHGFTSTLGFKVQTENYKRGYVFGKGAVTISIYQLDVTSVESMKWEKAPEEAAWFLEARTPPATGLLTANIDALTEVRDMLKGLVDLNRANIVSHV